MGRRDQEFATEPERELFGTTSEALVCCKGKLFVSLEDILRGMKKPSASAKLLIISPEKCMATTCICKHSVLHILFSSYKSHSPAEGSV